MKFQDSPKCYLFYGQILDLKLVVYAEVIAIWGYNEKKIENVIYRWYVELKKADLEINLEKTVAMKISRTKSVMKDIKLEGYTNLSLSQYPLQDNGDFNKLIFDINIPHQ